MAKELSREDGMKKISVIIPMYNGESFIRQSILSVTGQTYRNLEILVIDDGSTDGGPGICRELVALDGRIRILRQENGGVSSARNHGIEAATGEYVFFLDSDDAIHPLLLEKMMCQMEASQVHLGFCGYRKLDSGRLDMALDNGSGQESRNSRNSLADLPGESVFFAAQGDADTKWLTADEEETADWFHVKYTDILSGIGGKLILREAVGNLRFDRELSNGEDTFFLYQLIRRKIKSIYFPAGWYFYRMHVGSATHSVEMAKGKWYFECARRIRDGEFEGGNEEYAVRWEVLMVNQIRRNYAVLRQEKERKSLAELRKAAWAEERHPMFGRICFSDRLLFACCFCCYPLYVVLNGLALKWNKRRG